MAAVKTQNRLPKSYKRRLARAEISQQRVALASSAYHPDGHEVTLQFVNRVLNRLQACPDWLRAQLDRMLSEAAGE